MRHKIIRVGVLFVVAAACLSVGTSAGAVGAPKAEISGHYSTISSLPHDMAVTPNATSGTIHAGSCYYQQAVDNAHISSTSTTRATQSHGSWLNKGGTCPSKSNVDVYLQAVYCTDGNCGWKTVDKESGDVYAGGGSGKRITAHEDCSSTQTVGFRSYVDVDLNGVNDPSGYTYSTPKDLACHPSS
jgi:hypothetical protein